jgi:putative transcriptional regulator
MTIDVRKIRKSLDLTQSQFAERFGFNISTLRHWEQKQRIPPQATCILLQVIAQAPKIVEEVVHSKS